MDDSHTRKAVQQLNVIYADIAQRVHAIAEARPLWPCHKGCAG
jgi:hypothetical protein